MAKDRNAEFHSIHIQTRENAQNAPSPFTTFFLFYDGQFVTHEILSEKKFDKILVSKGLLRKLIWVLKRKSGFLNRYR
jgi:hypothetical protein